MDTNTKLKLKNAIYKLSIWNITKRTGLSQEDASKLAIPYRFLFNSIAQERNNNTVLYATPTVEEFSKSLKGLEEVFGEPSPALIELFLGEFLSLGNEHLMQKYKLLDYKFSDYDLDIMYSIVFLSLLGTDYMLKVCLSNWFRNILSDIQDRVLTQSGVGPWDVVLAFQPLGCMLDYTKSLSIGHIHYSENYYDMASQFIDFYFLALNNGLMESEAREQAISKVIKYSRPVLNHPISEENLRPIKLNININSTREYVYDKLCILNEKYTISRV